MKRNASVDSISLTDSILSRHSGTGSVKDFETIEETIDRATANIDDGGDLDAEGTGYLYTKNFVSATCNSNAIKLVHDYGKIEMNVDNVEDNHTVLFGALNIWKPPTVQEDWTQTRR